MYTKEYYDIIEEYEGCHRPGQDRADLCIPYYEKERNVKIDPNGSSIVEFFKGKNVFITGGTGFVGKLLIEKLLRACSDIGKIYIIVKSKKQKSIEERLDELFNDPVFLPLKELVPNFKEKIVSFNGDLILPALGLSLEDRQTLTEKVNVIFHVGATVRFDETIKTAVAINIKGTQEMLALGKECVNLESFVYVSTAYSNCPRDKIEEVVYDPPTKIDELIKIADTRSNNELEEMQSKILGEWPNTYTFSKAVAENIVKESSPELPVCIFRPSIIISTYREPVLGWTGNIYGPVGIALGASSGVLHSMILDEQKRADLVPADYVVNSMLAASYATAKDHKRNMKVYNYVSAIHNQLTWGEYIHLTLSIGKRNASIHQMWSMSCIFHTNTTMHKIHNLLAHYIPAYIFDTIAFIFGFKLRLLPVYRKIDKLTNALTFFSTNEWTFTRDNTAELWENLSVQDKKVFPFNMKEFVWNIYILSHILGIRKYLFKDELTTIPAARRKIKILDAINNIFIFIIYFMFFHVLYIIFSTIFRQFF